MLSPAIDETEEEEGGGGAGSNGGIQAMQQIE